MFKVGRIFAASALAFGSLFWSTPAQAYYLGDNYIQFTYYWEDHVFQVTDAILEITVTNNVTNKIGNDGEVIDSYKITVGDQVIEINEKHDAITYTFEIVGTQTVVLSGIDNGFWGGDHGPIMSWSETPLSSEPPVEEVPDNWWHVEWWEGSPVTISIMDESMVFESVRAWYGDPNGSCGIDVSEILTPIVVGNNSASWTADNSLFTDPCPGVVKVLRFAATITQSNVVEANPEPSPEPTPVPELPAQEEQRPVEEPPLSETPATPEIEQTPSPEPQPEATSEPTPIPESSSEPQPEIIAPEPEVAITPEGPSLSEPKPTDSEEPTVVPSEAPVEAVGAPEEPLEESVIPISIPEVEPLEALESLLGNDKVSVEEAAMLIELANEILKTAEKGSEEYEAALDALALAATADDIVLDEKIAAIPVIGALAEGLVDLINFADNVGADMAPETRERAEETVIAAVIVGQIAQVASLASISGGAYRRIT